MNVIFQAAARLWEMEKERQETGGRGGRANYERTIGNRESDKDRRNEI
jgi:hypothetical protein